MQTLFWAAYPRAHKMRGPFAGLSVRHGRFALLGQAMKTMMNRFLERMALVTLASGLSATIALQAASPDSRGSTTIRAERLEIVDSQGEVCVLLEASDRGGSVTISSPRRGEGKDAIIGYLGSTFGNDVSAFLREPKPGSQAGIGAFVGGQPSYPRITGTGVGGHPYFSLGGKGSKQPMLQLWHLLEEEPYFAK